MTPLPFIKSACFTTPPTTALQTRLVILSNAPRISHSLTRVKHTQFSTAHVNTHTQQHSLAPANHTLQTQLLHRPTGGFHSAHEATISGQS
jgi:hypothetical protein